MKLLPMMLGALLLSATIAHAHEPKGDQHVDVGLWLARSCVGEAGFDSSETGECAAIMHVYKKRAKISGKSIYEIARKYSAAIKPRDDRRNRWVLDLDRAGNKPDYWHPRLSWKHHRIWWELMLEHVDDFLKGRVKDPVPSAMHYGGRMDRYRLPAESWRAIHSLPFRNIFYESRTSKYRHGWLEGYLRPNRAVSPGS